MDWLKDRPAIQLLLNAFLTLLVMLIMLKVTGNMKSKDKLEDKISKKADKAYVDKQDDEIKEKIKSTETLFLDEIRELRKDLRLKQDKD
jgi:DNA-binding transcriptional regulator YiaG